MATGLEAPPKQQAPPADADAPVEEPELPAWEAIVAMVVVAVFLAAALISICFLAAKLATGHAY